MTVALIVFWAALTWLVWVYVVYPLVAWLFGRLRPIRVVRDGPAPTLVTIGMAVHDGSGEIAARIANVLGQEVPFPLEVVVASDGSHDATVREVGRIAAEDGRVRLLDLPHDGQSAAQAAIFDHARGDVVVLTDLETRFAPGCLAALVAPFADPRVGCVTGVLKWHFDVRTHTARHEGLYWRYEQQVRAWESRAGWLSAGTGALLAVRRSLYRPAPAHASLDQMLPLTCCTLGSLVVVQQSAIGSDRGPASLNEQFKSRTRIATQGIEANLRMSARVAPWRHPGAFVAIWSHKLLRWGTPIAALLWILSGVALWLSGESAGYLLPAAVAFVVGFLAIVGFIGLRFGRPVPLTGFPVTLAAVNLAFAAGWINVLLRRRVRTWESA